MQNTSGERLGYERMADIFMEVAVQSPTAIVMHLEDKVKTWCSGQRPGDDVSFLVLKVKDPARDAPIAS